MNKTLVLGCLALLGGALVLPRTAVGEEPSFRFHPDGAGFAFDTGLVRGKLRANGKSQGLSSVVHVPTGAVLSRSMGLMSHYRVFSANHRYGDAAWNWPSEARLTPEGTVTVRWPAAEGRPFELRSTYQWVSPAELDVVTSVQAVTNLLKFESFLACYLDSAFTNAQVQVASLPTAKGPGFLDLEEKFGLWLVFPRDPAALSIVEDGRWKYPPSPVDWVRMPALASPTIVRRSPSNGLALVFMARPQDCFAVLAPHQTEAHYSMYLSLLGQDLAPGKTAHARARLWIAQNPTASQITTAANRFKATASQ